MCVCVCVCVEREREREGGRNRERGTYSKSLAAAVVEGWLVQNQIVLPYCSYSVNEAE